jgi:hypothetical protein
VGSHRPLAALVLAALAASPALAQESAAPGPQITLTSSYTFDTQDVPGEAWTASQSAALGLSGRWGQALKLEGQVNAPFDNSPLTADSLVSQLALTWDINAWSVVTFGKQRLKWGTAKVFSAVDGLEPTYDPLHPRAVLAGVTGMKVEWLPNEWLGLSALVLPAAALADSKTALRADVLWDDTDLSAGAIRSTVSGTRHLAVYADFARFFDRFGLYGEVQAKDARDRAWSFTAPGATLGLAEAAGWTPKATLGLQVEVPVWLDGTLRWVTESHYNGAGFSPAEGDDFRTAWDRRTGATSFSVPPALAGGGVGAFSRHYAYSGVSGIPVTTKLSVGASALAGLDTGFVLARADLGYEVDQSLSASLSYARFDTLPGSGGRASEALLIPQRDQVTLTVAGSF